MLSKSIYQKRLFGIFNDPEKLREKLNQFFEQHSEISEWLGNNSLLSEIPLNYIVPDENMLPLESIKFFYVDRSWINAFLDGILSIGRNPDLAGIGNTQKFDKSIWPIVKDEAIKAAANVRTKLLGIKNPKNINLGKLSGFLLRSTIVTDYPGLEVNGYTTQSGIKGELKIVRMEKIAADTLICIFAGDLIRVVLHETPEALHYGVDCYSYKDDFPECKKNVFDLENGIIDRNNIKTIDLAQEGCLRNNNSRVLEMAKIALVAGKKANSNVALNSAEMGFQMIEGAGMVSFRKNESEK